jgi:outer membrane protein assembly factor BamB
LRAEKYVHSARSFYDSGPTDMRFEIVVAPDSLHPLEKDGIGVEEASSRTELRALPRRRHSLGARAVLDVFLDGANVTAQIRDTHAHLVVRDLALALVDLGRGLRAKATVAFHGEPWEICVERVGSTAYLSVYRGGSKPLVTVYDRALPFDDVVAAARDAIERLLTTGNASEADRRDLESAAAQLAAAGPATDGDVAASAAQLVTIDVDRDAPLAFGAEFSMRERPSARPGAPAGADDAEIGVERADIHALLFRGRVRAEVRGKSVDLGECHPVLLVEALLDLARRAFDAWERGIPMSARHDAMGVLVGVHLSSEGKMALTLGSSSGPGRRAIHTFPALGVSDVLEATLAFGRALVRAVVRRDRSQARNLRLSALRRSMRDATDALRETAQTDAKLNPLPEPYRAFAEAVDSARREPPPSVAEGRLRYTSRWRAIVPGIDLRATYLCGDRLVVGAAGEMWAIDRVSGGILWRSDAARGTSVVTPGGIARIAGDGTIRVHGFATGHPDVLARIAPRVGPMAGAVVSHPGLPKVLVITEGEHHLVAIDLTTGEHRWRWSWGATRRTTRGLARSAPRVKRSGRLLYVTCGDGSLTALDIVTGAVVWRVRDRLRFRTPPTVVRDALFVVAGGAHGVARLYRIDPYSGHVEWSTPASDATSPCTVEGAPLVAALSVAVAVRHKRGLSLAAFRRTDGAPVGAEGSRSRVVAPNGTSWLAVDDVFIGNAASGELVAIDAPTGELRWRHVLGPRPLEADVPRRLEPVLRSGALFVPCSFVSLPQAGGNRSQSVAGGLERGETPVAGVSIVRPSDGKLLGAIAPTEAIPDLLRVDERCDVYVAEESGHLAAFGALPRLSLV